MKQGLDLLVRSGAVPAACLIGALLGCGVEEVELREPATRPVLQQGSAAAAEPVPAPVEGSKPVGAEPPVSAYEVNAQADLDDFGVSAPPPPAEKGCKKVDFLFVVDNSSSMLHEQSNLTSSFPGFLRVVRETLAAGDFHIMVVDTDGWDGESGANADPCANALGAGKRLGANGQDCGVAGKARYLSDDQPDLEDTFACVAEVGTFGDSGEQAMDAMIQAVGAAQNQRSGCNQNFLREDAILVVTFITDEDDNRSSGNPAAWRQALLDSKRGEENAIVLLGLVNDANLDPPLAGGRCSSFSLLPLTPRGAPLLQSFARSFTQGSLASVCAPDYSPFFARAVSAIDTACDEFIPPVIR